MESLYRLGKSTVNPLIDHAVNQAIAAIQARHGHGDQGWLSVDEQGKAGGGLSLNDRSEKKGLLSTGSDEDLEQ